MSELCQIPPETPVKHRDLRGHSPDGFRSVSPAAIAGMDGGFNAIVPYLIIVIAGALFLYARAMRQKNVLA